MIYSTDNGPNNGFGESSQQSCIASGNQPTGPDELVLAEFGQYYGHSNCNRGRYDPRQTEWHDQSGQSIIGEFTQAITTFPSSTNGIVEYRANNFNGALRHNLIAQKLNNLTFRVELSEDRRTVVNNSQVPTLSLNALDVVGGPGGALIGMDHAGNKITVAEPVNPPTSNLCVYDVYPWRAPATGGHPFVIGGENFGTVLGNVTVTLGGLNATLTGVSNTRIFGVVPVEASPAGELVDIFVTVGAQSQVLTQAFRYLRPPGGEPWGWHEEPEVPVALGEVAGGIINGKLYLVGEGSDHSRGTITLRSSSTVSFTSVEDWVPRLRARSRSTILSAIHGPQEPACLGLQVRVALRS
jgi:hypothetical protein